jgi:hypothetical protein
MKGMTGQGGAIHSQPPQWAIGLGPNTRQLPACRSQHRHRSHSLSLWQVCLSVCLSVPHGQGTSPAARTQAHAGVKSALHNPLRGSEPSGLGASSGSDAQHAGGRPGLLPPASSERSAWSKHGACLTHFRKPSRLSVLPHVATALSHIAEQPAHVTRAPMVTGTDASRRAPMAAGFQVLQGCAGTTSHQGWATKTPGRFLCGTPTISASTSSASTSALPGARTGQGSRVAPEAHAT